MSDIKTPSIADLDPKRKVKEENPVEKPGELSIGSVNLTPMHRTTAIGGAKNFHRTENHANPSRLATRIKFTCDNSGGGTAKVYDFFDPAGIVANLAGGTRYQASPTELTMAIINKVIQGSPVLFSGFRMEVSSSVAQFNNVLKLYEGSLDGALAQIPIHLEDALEGDKYNEKIQSYRADIMINKFRMLSLSVDAGETVKVTFFINAMAY